MGSVSNEWTWFEATPNPFTGVGVGVVVAKLVEPLQAASSTVQSVKLIQLKSQDVIRCIEDCLFIPFTESFKKRGQLF